MPQWQLHSVNIAANSIINTQHHTTSQHNNKFSTLSNFYKENAQNFCLTYSMQKLVCWLEFGEWKAYKFSQTQNANHKVLDALNASCSEAMLQFSLYWFQFPIHCFDTVDIQNVQNILKTCSN